MKKQLLFLIVCLIFQITFSQVFDVETIKNEGPNGKRINVVILGDGYIDAELDQFESDANDFVTALFSQSPFSAYSSYFNVHIIKVISNESGANHPGTATDESSYNVPVSEVDNFFGSTYDGFGSHRLLYAPNTALVMTVLSTNFPEYDQALILVNAPYYGGSGGEFPVSSTGEDADEIAIHEMGHSLVDLKDEYYPGDLLAEEGINMTQETDPALVRWNNWVGAAGVGVYPYCSTGSCASWNRPHQTCKMRYLGFPFCAVCTEGIIEKIHDLVSPIDEFSPNNTVVENPSFPLQFDLTLNTPMPNSLESSWTLNASNFNNNVTTISIEENELIEGTNTLTAVITDNSNLQDIDNHESIHFYTVTWTIDNSTLSTFDIAAEENRFDIQIFPNPTENILSIKSKNSKGSNMSVDITSIDGKVVFQTDLLNLETNEININQLSRGIYILNFYSDSTLLMSKKIIKK